MWTKANGGQQAMIETSDNGELTGRTVTGTAEQADNMAEETTTMVNANGSRTVEKPLRWYAARTIDRRKQLEAYLDGEGIRRYSAPAIPSILFIRCDAASLDAIREEFRGAVLFYLNADRSAPAQIPEKEMASFIIVTSGNGELVELEVRDRSFLEGQRVRVIGGPFEGAEGVVRRIKGDRRLIVEIPGVTVVATSFIHPSLLVEV